MKIFTVVVALFLFCSPWGARAETFIEVKFGENPPHLYVVQNGEIKVKYMVAVARPNIKLQLPIEGSVTQIQVQAPWYPTQKSRDAYAEQHKGSLLPAIIPYGDPRNMMGAGKMLLAFPQGWTNKPLRIHGTTVPSSIGKRVSSGCVRMLDADFLDLAQILASEKLPIKMFWR